MGSYVVQVTTQITSSSRRYQCFSLYVDNKGYFRFHSMPKSDSPPVTQIKICVVSDEVTILEFE
jgi:hypothetical protein